MEIKKLIWDSAFFQKNIGQFTGKLSPTSDFSNASDFDLVYLMSSQALPKKTIDELQSYWEVNLVDIKQVFRKALTQEHQSNPHIRRINKPDSNEDLKTLALLSGEYSRFKLDKNFTEMDFKRLYLQWLENSFNDKMAKKVYIHEINQRISGMISLDYDETTAKIGLIAVSPKYRGKGIAQVLIKTTENESFKLNKSFLDVATQKANIPAVRLYLKNGFELNTQTFIYHLWKIKQ